MCIRDSLGLGRLRAHVGADRGRPLDDVVAQGAQAFDLDLDDIAGVDLSLIHI